MKIISRVEDFLVNNYYIMIIFLYFITLKKNFFPVGVGAAMIMMCILICMLLTRKLFRRMRMLDAVVLLYGIYCMGTGVYVFLLGIPMKVFITAVSNGLLPIIFYYAARRENHLFYKRSLWAIQGCCIVGLILLWKMPQWYYLYCRTYGFSYTRLSSCIGSTAIGSLSVIAILISIQMLYDSKGRKAKIFYCLSVLYAFCSMQRSAWIVALMSIVLMHYLIFFKWRTIKLRYFAVELAGVGVGAFILRNRIMAMIVRWLAEHAVAERAMAGRQSGMFSSRTGTWIEGLRHSNLLFGNGFGTVGHKAVGYVDYIIADGSWACLLCEIGIVGIGLFILILLKTVELGMHNLKKAFLPLGIWGCIALQAIGSNMFEYQLIMPFFWYAIGQIGWESRNYKKKREERQHENIGNVSAAVS